MDKLFKLYNSIALKKGLGSVYRSGDELVLQFTQIAEKNN